MGIGIGSMGIGIGRQDREAPGRQKGDRKHNEGINLVLDMQAQFACAMKSFSGNPTGIVSCWMPSILLFNWFIARSLPDPLPTSPCCEARTYSVLVCYARPGRRKAGKYIRRAMWTAILMPLMPRQHLSAPHGSPALGTRLKVTVRDDVGWNEVRGRSAGRVRRYVRSVDCSSSSSRSSSRRRRRGSRTR